MAKRGRPTQYKKQFVEEVYKLCALGATDKELADFFKVKEQTINNWKNNHPDFFESIEKGKEKYDTKMIEAALRERAKGYSHPDVHISSYQGEITETPIIKHYPPDTKAIELWLTNRDPKRWKRVVNAEHTGEVSIKVVRDD